MRHRAGRWPSRFVIPGLVLLAMWTAGCTPHVLDVDIAQERLDVATPPLDGSHTVAQSFVPQYANLSEIELLPAVYESPGQGTLTLHLHSLRAGGTELATQTVDVARISHNVPLRFSFPAQHDSAGTSYELRAEGEPGVRVGFWYNSINAYGDGQLQLDGRYQAGDLRFITRSRYDLGMATREAQALLDSARLAVPLVALLLLPGGILWAYLNPGTGGDPIANLAMRLALSLAAVPVALLWSTVLGIRWDRTLCLAAFAAMAVCGAAYLLRGQIRGRAIWLGRGYRSSTVVMVMVLALTLLLRFAQIRKLVLPAWVDSNQHALVTELVAMHGQVPQSYEPLLPVQAFAYHFGFHADLAAFHWLSGLAIPQAMLLLGQVLNAASALMAYLLTRRLTGRRVAAIAAAVVVGLVSFLPAYYVSWGRYTQLTGLLLLPPTMVAAMDWLEAKRPDHRLLIVAGLLNAGLFLTHARVTIFGICFLVVYLLFETFGHWRQHAGRGMVFELWRRGAMLGLLALALSGPWLVQIARVIYGVLRAAGGSLRGDASYNAFPWEFLYIARNRQLLVLAGLGAMWGLRHRRKETVWILAWCGLVLLVINPSGLGLPATSLLNNATAVISLFVPLSVLNGQAFTLLWDHGPALAASLNLRHGATAIRATLVLLIAGFALWGAWGMISIVNPTTVLAAAEDLAAMDWIQQNLSPQAVFLINTRLWQLGVYTGTDGGYWIQQMTGRRTLLPSIPYA
ncbi:MAG: hypothetical protein JSW37_00925, partial [Anaerolineales bacterium]